MIKSITFSVSQDDLTYGVQKDATRCVIARALHRIFPESTIVVGEHIFIDQIMYDCSPELRQYIDTFDEKGKEVLQPQTFTIYLSSSPYQMDEDK